MSQAEGKRIASCVSLSEQHLIPPDPYSNRSADEVEEDDVDFGMVDDEEIMPDKLVYHDSAIILIPRNKLHHLLGSDADIGAIMALVVDDQKNHPSGVSVRVDMLELMTRILDSCKDKLAGFAILEGAWNLRDMSLYRRGIRHCTADGYIPNELPKLLATLVAASPAPQVVDWNECLGDLLDCSRDIRRIFRRARRL